MSVSKRLRYEVMARDGFACRYCHVSDVQLTIDHVVPVALGGNDKPDNLVTACKDCNAGKSSTNPEAELVENVGDDALRWAAAMKVAAERQAKQIEEQRVFIDAVDAVWCEGLPNGNYTPIRPDDWQRSVITFHEAGLPLTAMLHLVEQSLRSSAYGAGNHWRYFCGCCWRQIRDMQELAKGLIEDGSV